MPYLLVTLTSELMLLIYFLHQMPRLLVTLSSELMLVLLVLGPSRCQTRNYDECETLPSTVHVAQGEINVRRPRGAG